MLKIPKLASSHLRPRHAIAFLLFTGAFVSLFANAADTQYDSALRSRIDSEQDCFNGMFATYDSWTEGLKANNSNFDLNTKYAPSRDTFDRYKRELDCRWILYPSLDGQLVNGFIITPKKFLGTNTRLPIVIYNRGGSAVAQTPVVMGSLIDRFFPLSVEGFVVAGSQYRGLRSRLLGPQRDPGRDEFGGADVGDVTALLDIVAALPNSDSTKIGMYGWSRGGMQSFLVARRNARIGAIVVGGALTDLEDWRKFRPEVNGIYKEIIPGSADTKEAAIRERSAILWADEIPKSAPVLLIHGTKDDSVPFRQSVAMSMRLHELGHAHELVLVGNGPHALMGEHSEHVNELALSWFKRYLK